MGNDVGATMGKVMMFSGRKPLANVAFNMRLRRGPFGGGNQWLSQVSAYFLQTGYRTSFKLDSGVDCVLGTHAGIGGALTIPYAAVAEAKTRNPRLMCIQRINDNDLRKGTDKMDALLAEANRAADHTVFVSRWLRDHHAAKWFDVRTPHSVIRYGGDPAVFHPFGAAVWKPGGPLRIVTHHWSDNIAKGFDLYARLDDEIASGRVKGVELWVIGRWPKEIRWRAARTFGPCAGRELASLLRQCHVGLSASRYEPGAMHPVEMLQCGMPLLYTADTGGTVELGEKFGVLVEGGLNDAIEAMRAGYESLRARVVADGPSGDGMCLAYRKLVQSLLCR